MCIIFDQKTIVEGESHYRSEHEQIIYEKTHEKVFDKVSKYGIKFKSEKFLIPEHVNHFQRYLETHRKNLEELNSLILAQL